MSRPTTSQRILGPVAVALLLVLLLTAQVSPDGDQSTSTVIMNLAAATDDQPFPVSPGETVTLLSAFCWCQGTCSTPAQISFEYVETGTGGPTITDVTGSVTCQAYTSAHSPTTLSGSRTIAAGDVLRFDVDNAVSPETDTYSICVRYQKN